MKIDHDLSLLVAQMAEVYNKYVTFTDDDHAFICALWCAHTHLFRTETKHGLYTTGYLAFVSPEHNCGKSSALTVTCAFARGQPAVNLNPTPATIFRQIGDTRNTIVLDELDVVREEPLLLSILNGGYKDGATVPRMTGNDFSTLESFPVFCPKAFGYIRNQKSLRTILPSLESRCIRVFMKKRTPKEQRESEYLYSPQLHHETEPIYRALAKWELENAKLDFRPLFMSKKLWIDGFYGREMEVWDGVLAVAYLIGKLERAQRAAGHIVHLNRSEMLDHDNPDAQLLGDIRDNLNAMVDEWGFSTELASEFLRRMDERPYSGTDRELPRLTTKLLANRLAAYGLRTVRSGPADKRVRRIPVQVLLDTIRRYVPEETEDEE